MFVVPVFGAFAEETSSVPDLDDPEQRLAYELSFVQGELSRERVVYLTSHYATITLSSGGTVTGEGHATGLANTVTSLFISSDTSPGNGRPLTTTRHSFQVMRERRPSYARIRQR